MQKKLTGSTFGVRTHTIVHTHNEKQSARITQNKTQRIFKHEIIL